MIYLLDVNALIALGLLHHQFHDRIAAWVQSLKSPQFATCAITELGFVRVLSHAPAYGLTVAQAQDILLRLKRSTAVGFTFIVDDHDIATLPMWVKTAKQTTDGHLQGLAQTHNATLATLDEAIPGAFLIP